MSRSVLLKIKFAILVLLTAMFVTIAVCACDNADGVVTQKYVLCYLAGNGGYISGDVQQTVTENLDGDSVKAVASEGYYFVEWSDGIRTAERTDKGVIEDLTVTARFERIGYIVLYQTDGNGTIEGEATQSVKYGENTTVVKAVPNEGYRFVEWSDGIKTAERTDKSVTTDISVTAKFEKVNYTVEYQTDGNGMINGEAIQSVKHDENTMSVTAVPNEGYEFMQWSDGMLEETRQDINVVGDFSVTAIFQKKIFQVTYETNYHNLGLLIEKGDPYDTIRIIRKVAYGENAPIVTALPIKGIDGSVFEFICWSDGVQTAERHDKYIKSDMTVTACFGYRIDYKVDGNVGGRIEGKSTQKVLPDHTGEEVRALADDGYVFMGWSDLSTAPIRSENVQNPKDYGYYDSINLEIYAYFAPIEKIFRYDYGYAQSNTMPKEVTLNRNTIQTVNFVVPQHDGYKFCGWYADRDYRIKIANENGKYMYGYAAFMLESETLYAKWQKEGEESDNHKILLIYVDDVQGELFSPSLQSYIHVDSQMTALDYELCDWITTTMYDLLTEWFDGKVTFEIDSYYTTKILTEDRFKTGSVYNYQLMAYDIDEVFDIMNTYHNTVTCIGYKVYNYRLFDGEGVAFIKDASVCRDRAWDGVIRNRKDVGALRKYMSNLKNGEVDWDQTIIDTYMHELAHTAEMYYNFNIDDPYCLHEAIGYSLGHSFAGDMVEMVLKPFLLGEFDMDGVKTGVPSEYWEHRMKIRLYYVDQPLNGKSAGKIIYEGQTEDDREPWDRGIGGLFEYGGNLAVEAVPDAGYRFVKWSDGVTTAVRRDKVIAYFRVEAIFEKII